MTVRRKNFSPGGIGFLVGMAIFYSAFWPVSSFSQSAALLPNAMQVFLDVNGNPLSGGTVGFYFPSTLNLKPIWQNANESIVYTNPVTLNAAGQPPSATGIYGQGAYRQIVKDINNNTIWDALTSSTGAGGGSAATGDGDAVGTVKPWAGIVAPNQYMFAYGEQLSRITFAALFIAITQSTTVTCTSSSNTLGGIADTTSIGIGASVEVSCVPPGTVIISKTSSTVVMSNPSTVSLNTTAVFFPFGNGDGSTTFTLPDFRGNVIAGRQNMGGTASTNLSGCSAAQGILCGAQTETLTRSQLPNITYTPIFSGSSVNIAGGQVIAGTTSTAQSGSGATIPVASFGTGSVVAAGTINPFQLNGGVSQNAFTTVQPTITLNYIIKVTPDTNSAIATGVTDISGMVGSIACGLGITCTGNTISISNISQACNNLPSGVDCNAFNSASSNYPVQTTDCGKTLNLGGNAFYTLTVGAASGFSPTCTFNVVNTDSGRGKLMTINGITFPNLGVLWPSQNFVLKNENNTWTVIGLPNAWKITSAVTYNIDTATGVDGSNDCLGALGTSGACASLANAINTFCQTAYVVGAQVTFQTKTGQTHPKQSLCEYSSAGLTTGANNPVITGDATSCTTASNFTIDGGTGAGLNPVGIRTPWRVTGIKLMSSTLGVAASVDNHSQLYIGTNVTFPAASAITIQALYDSFVEFNGNFCITGGASVFADATEGGRILAQSGLTATLTGTPAFSVAFAQSEKNALQVWTGVIFSGSATGPRIVANLGGGIDTNGAPTNLPGNSAGTTTAPGWSN